jgi:hypothetical protein
VEVGRAHFETDKTRFTILDAPVSFTIVLFWVNSYIVIINVPPSFGDVGGGKCICGMCGNTPPNSMDCHRGCRSLRHMGTLLKILKFKIKIYEN